MAHRVMGRLNALKVSRANEPGMYGDGGGLYLQVSRGGAKSWIYRYMLRGRSRDMGIGGLLDTGLAEAREKAAQARKLKQQGFDPIDARKEMVAQERISGAKAIAFKDAVDRYISAHEPSWKNAKHRQQWRNTLATYAESVFGSLPVASIDTGLILKALEPIWATKPETAGRLRGRIEAVLDWAGARGYRYGENPARWRGHLDKLLPKPSKVRKVRHHAALPYSEVGKFLRDLRQQAGVAARGLEFLILTAARTSEVIGAQTNEIDLSTKAWIVPGERMKAGNEHRVPLSPAAVSVVEACDVDDGYCSPSAPMRQIRCIEQRRVLVSS